MDTQQSERALNDLTAIVQLGPGTLDARQRAFVHRSRAQLYYQRRDFDEAVNNLDATLQLNPGDAHAHFMLGGALLSRQGSGDVQKAVVALTTAIEHEPSFAPAFQLRAFCYRSLGEEGLAEKDLKKYSSLMQQQPMRE